LLLSFAIAIFKTIESSAKLWSSHNLKASCS
jgi:hypothetical protein